MSQSVAAFPHPLSKRLASLVTMGELLKPLKTIVLSCWLAFWGREDRGPRESQTSLRQIFRLVAVILVGFISSVFLNRHLNAACHTTILRCSKRNHQQTYIIYIYYIIQANKCIIYENIINLYVDLQILPKIRFWFVLQLKIKFCRPANHKIYSNAHKKSSH